MRPFELLELIKQRDNDQVFFSALEDDPIKALQGHGYAIDPEDVAAVRAIDWSQSDAQTLLGLPRIVEMWGRYTSEEVSEWATRFELSVDDSVATWFGALTKVVHQYGISSLYLL